MLEGFSLKIADNDLGCCTSDMINNYDSIDFSFCENFVHEMPGEMYINHGAFRYVLNGVSDA